MVEKKEHPKVFISYARTNPQFTERVVNFTNTLRSNGIDAKMDEFELKLGHDLYYFMESKIKLNDFVLLLLNKEFINKADNREGGVGTETKLMSKEVYTNAKQEKVIGIILEHDENGNPLLPTFLESNFSIDFSSDEKRAENYELLLRTLYQEPKYIQEELGEKPLWLKDKNVYYSATNSIINNFDYQVSNHSEKFNSMINEFFDKYLEYLNNFEVKITPNGGKSISKDIYENLERYKLLKKDLDVFIEKMFKINYIQIDSDIIIEFLSNLCSLVCRKAYPERVHFDFILREIFLYFIAYGLKYKNYSFVADLLYSPYYFDDYHPQKTIKYFVDLDLRGDIDTYKILSIPFKSDEDNPFQTSLSELLIKRIPPNLKREQLVDADLLCCYISCMNKDQFDTEIWLPYTYIYKNSKRFDYFTRLISKNYFNKVKELFNVDSVEEFKVKVKSTYDTILTRRRIYIGNFLNYVKPIEDYIDLDRICSER